MLYKKEKGITIIALVITIVVIIILGAIGVTLLSRDNGVIMRAKNTLNTTSKLGVNEAQQVNYLRSGETNQEETLVTDFKANHTSITSEVTEVFDVDNNKFYIPRGFKIPNDSAISVKDGIVIEDASGNQFVWIPVNSSNPYTRYAFGSQVNTGITDTNTNSIEIKGTDNITAYYIESLDDTEKASVEKYGGYYIGRYEASSIDNKVAIKKDQDASVNMLKEVASTSANGMATEQGYSGVFTKLLSSYAWDTALKFIDQTNSGYSSNGVDKGNFSGKVYKTGNTTAVCNIYDIAGNIYEFTSEITTTNSNVSVIRGASYWSPTGVYTGIRRSDSTYGASIGYRVALFLN